MFFVTIPSLSMQRVTVAHSMETVGQLLDLLVLLLGQNNPRPTEP